MKLRPSTFLATITALAGVSLSSAFADGHIAPKNPDPIIEAESPWTVEIIPYGWAAGVEGSTAIGRVESDFDIGFDEVFGELDAAFMIAAGIKRGRFGFLTDFQYISVSPSRPTRGPLFDSIGVDYEQTNLNLLLTYDVIADDRLTLTVLAGARYMNIDSTLSVSPGLIQRGFAVSAEQSSWDAVGGLRAKYYLSDRLFLSFYGDAGGSDSESTWQLYGGAGYHLNERLHLALGYRILSYDFEGDVIRHQVDTEGILLGLGLTF